MISIVDVDGTISDPTWRLERLASHIKDPQDANCLGHLPERLIQTFMEGCGDDPLIEHAIKPLRRLYRRSSEMVFVTSRWNKYYRETTRLISKALGKNAGYYLYMRTDEETETPTAMYKYSRVYHIRSRHRALGQSVSFYDDDQSTLDAVKNLGVRCFKAPECWL